MRLRGLCMFLGFVSIQLGYGSEIQRPQQRAVHTRYQTSTDKTPTALFDESNVDTHEKAYVAICLQIQNQHNEIREWIEYHHYLGVEKFYLYDDMSEPPILETIKDFVDDGLVTYFYLGTAWMGVDFNVTIGTNNKQKWAYNSCYKWFHKRHQFMGIIDVDEFVVLRDEQTGALQRDLVSFLQKYENETQVRLFWRVFGSSGKQQQQPSTLLSYTKCLPEYDTSRQLDPELDKREYQRAMMLWQYKSFINSAFPASECDIHDCITSFPGVNTHHTPMGLKRQKRLQFLTLDKAFIAHYMIKSEEDQRMKTQRGSATMPGRKRDQKFYGIVDEEASADCLFMREIARECCEANRNAVIKD
eukprot:TRINITY_DN4297_c0_g4_i1.p2 TRINITY_DN4297_c0_g4~~TRINITY_DN4297_c0_g4_i1.p2  ORF type:complete len:378 (+),score=38.20 TRINITY_DN4297_c0_g4_i1:58-1134(+)